MHADQRSGTCWGEPDLLRDRREVIAPLGEVSQRRESKLLSPSDSDALYSRAKSAEPALPWMISGCS